jgi:hypothetical protein
LASALPLALEALSDLLAEQDLELDSFAPEELALAVSPETPQLVPLPEPADPEQTKAALEERGSWDPEEDEATGDLAAVAALRAAPAVLVIADSLSPEGQSSTSLYGIGGAGFLEERASPERHEFVVRSNASAARLLASLADPLDRAHEDGEPLERRGLQTPPAWEGLERMLQTAEHVLQLLVVRPTGEGTGEDVMASIATTADGVWLVSGWEAGQNALVRAQRCSRGSLEEGLLALLQGAP